jgi:hypothetical protein
MRGGEFVQGAPDQGRAIGCVALRYGVIEQFRLLLINENYDLVGHSQTPSSPWKQLTGGSEPPVSVGWVLSARVPLLGG